MNGKRSPEHQDLFANLIHLYVLHHASKQPTFGLQIIEELAQFGYKLSPGTIYPLLDRLERIGLVRSREVKNGSVRRLYRATAAGRKALASASEQARKLIREVCKRDNRLDT